MTFLPWLYFLLPLFFFPGSGDQTFVPKMVLFQSGVLLVLWAQCLQPRLREYKPSGLLWVFVGWILIRFIFLVLVPVVLHGPVVQYSMIASYWNLFMALILFWLLIENASNEDWVFLSQVIVLASVLSALWGIGQYFGMGPFEQTSDLGISASAAFGNPMLFGSYLAVAGSLSLAVCWPLFLIISTGAYLSGSFNAILVCLVVLVLYLLLKNGWEPKLWAFSVLAMAYAFRPLDPPTLSNRPDLWDWAWKCWTISGPRFWRGRGLGVYQLLSPEAGKVGYQSMGEWGSHVHNEYLQLGVELGIVGLVLLLAAVVHVLYKYLRLPDKTSLSNAIFCGFIAFLLSSVTGFPLHEPACAALGIFYFAALSYFVSVK